MYLVLTFFWVNYICLSLENTCESSFLKLATVIYGLGVLPWPNLGVSNFVKVLASNEISISFFYLTIYKEHFVNAFPRVVALLSKFAIALHPTWVLNLFVSTELSFPYCIIFSVIPYCFVYRICFTFCSTKFNQAYICTHYSLLEPRDKFWSLSWNGNLSLNMLGSLQKLEGQIIWKENPTEFDSIKSTFYLLDNSSIPLPKQKVSQYLYHPFDFEWSTNVADTSTHSIFWKPCLVKNSLIFPYLYPVSN